MKNSVKASVEFSFQGASYTPSGIIDLDKMMALGGTLPDLHVILAKQNGIDTYSYLYEVMEAHEISFSDPTGLAVDCLTDDGALDLEHFATLWKQEQELSLLNDIAKQYLKLKDLQQHPDIKAALMAAYQAGIARQVVDGTSGN